jgi:hypothetical protein
LGGGLPPQQQQHQQQQHVLNVQTFLVIAILAVFAALAQRGLLLPVLRSAAALRGRLATGGRGFSPAL